MTNFKFEFISNLDTFLFEMQNVTVACSTFLFNYLIPIKKLIFQRLQSYSYFEEKTFKYSGQAHNVE